MCPLKREWRVCTVKAVEATQGEHRKLGEEADALGEAQWIDLQERLTFREFVSLYIAEGHKPNRNVVSIANSDDRVVAVAVGWLRSLSDRRLSFSIQYHADHGLDELRRFWGVCLGIDGAAIRVQRKSNSNQIAGRTWRSEHGVLTATVNDTMLRARLQAWIGLIRREWTLDSAPSHGV